MSQLEAIKHQLHDKIDQIDDENVLVHYLKVISSEIKGEATDFWDDLAPEEQAEILEAYEESEDESNLIPNEVVRQRYAKWLTK